MSNLRFGLLAFGLFALIFVGGSWARKGFPVMTVGVVPLKPDSRIPTFEEATQQGIRRDWVNSKTNQSDGNAARDKVRRELLQASTAYSMSPCDDTIRKNLIEALTNYTQAWHDIAYCRPGVGGCPTRDDLRMDAGAAAFTTPADVNVRKAARSAMDQGGISLDDFPRALRNFVFVWTDGPPSEPKEACLIARQTASRR